MVYPNVIFTIILTQFAIFCGVLITLGWKINHLEYHSDSLYLIVRQDISSSTVQQNQGRAAGVDDQPMSPLLVHSVVDTHTPLDKPISNDTPASNPPKKINKLKNPQHKKRTKTKWKRRPKVVLTDDDIKSAPLPDHCLGQQKKGEIVIKGERHSGTNLLEHILSSNTWNPISTSTFGWKHGMLNRRICLRRYISLMYCNYVQSSH